MLRICLESTTGFQGTGFVLMSFAEGRFQFNFWTPFIQWPGLHLFSFTKLEEVYRSYKNVFHVFSISVIDAFLILTFSSFELCKR